MEDRIVNLANVNTDKVQIFAVLGSLLFIIFILYQIRSKRMKEEYSLLWLLAGGIFFVFSVWREGLNVVARAIGVAYPPAALFMLLLFSIFMILIQYSTIISKLASNNKHLTQEHALLKLEVQEMKKRLDRLEKGQQAKHPKEKGHKNISVHHSSETDK